MVVFTVENRVKEIGIRKVMGASEFGVTILLSQSFIKLRLIASLIAVPLTWLFFENVFLRQQYYKVGIGIFEVGISVALLLVMGSATILPQTVKAARANPADILKNE
jgi:ABC-type antimicrobial peptide transport system permease subunit